ncbi:MAG: glycoside hydrolase family 9 protein [Ignavibacteria bacterium]|nr:glycoside hydrolase family 9 protein [Ignavibacteria bacterium]
MNKLVLSIYLFFMTSSFCLSQVFVNQAGYKTFLPKYFYTNKNALSYQVIEKTTGQIVHSGQLTLINANDPATGMTIRKGDFSSFTGEGTYYIKLNTNDTSYHFQISSKVYEDVFKKSLKAFYFQRCGSQLFYTHAGIYQRNICHTGDGFFHSSTGQSGFKLSRGGWHDAGDYGKYIVNAGISTATLLMAYELFPSYFNSDSLNIPESGNGIPDILDEAKYEVQWFLTMQASDGAVYHKLTKEQFEAFVMPSQDSGMRYIYQKSSTATGNFIAVLARFYRLYKIYDSVFANQCLSAALNGWNWLSNQPSIVPPGGFKNPTGTQTGEYGDFSDSDERLWAAAELFDATGQQQFKDYFEFNYNLGGLINSTMNWQNVRTLAHLTYLFSKQPGKNNSVISQILNSLISYSNGLLNRRSVNGFGVTINPGEYYWGSNSQILNNGILLVLTYAKTNDNKYLSGAIEQFNYILGSNAHNLSFVTGVGKKYPMKPHHRPSEADGIIEPIPGFVVGGPNQYLDDPILQQNFNQNTPPALCYIDHLQSWASNEVAINWNAPLVFLSGFFNNFFLTNVEKEKEIIFDFKLEQNFPNPFNSQTKIRFSINSTSDQELYRVKMKIINLLGEEIVTLIDEYKTKGNYEYIFDASNLSDEKFTSGVYFYQLQMNEKSITRKMIYLK